MKYIGEVFQDRRRDYLDIRNEYYKSEEMKCDLVMMGDSITEGFNFPFAGVTNIKVINSGVSGDRLRNIHYRIYKDGINLKPSSIMLMAGINDLLSEAPYTTTNYKTNIEELFDEYSKVVEMIADNEINPICCGMIKINQFEHNHMFKNQQIEYFNNLVEELATQNKYQYIDFNEVLADEYGGINTTYFSDGLHPNEKGYFEMFKYLRVHKVL